MAAPQNNQQPINDQAPDTGVIPSVDLESNLDALAKSMGTPADSKVATDQKLPSSPQAGPSLTLSTGSVKPIQELNKPVQTISQSGSQDVAISGTLSGNIAAKLIEKGMLTDEQLNSLKFESVNAGKSIESLIIERGIITEEDLYQTKSEVTGIPFVELRRLDLSVETIQKIPFDIAKKNLAIAFDETPGKMKVAMIDPSDLQKLKFLSAVVGRQIEPHYATPSDIKRVLDTKYSVKIEEEVTEALEDVGDVVRLGHTLGSEEDLGVNIGSAPVSRIVNMVLEYAVKFKASDVHIEPREGKIAVRYRLNGVMSERLTLPKKLGSSIVSRIKILSNLKIDEHRIPQDGRFQVKVGKTSIDLRVSIMPAAYGEKVVMRLLEKGGGIMSIEDTGLEGTSLKVFRDSLSKTQGIILVTGPTGSGKTQSLASSLKILNKPEVNIMTIEDPVEIRIDGVTQVQVNPEVGLTFAKALRSFLRQDPDIIMVGEIRDSETADLAVQASLTGHLILATLHTSSAAGALPRLLDMKIEPFLLSSTVEIVVGQRLVRQICPDCIEKYEASEPIVKKLHEVLQGLKGFDLYAYPKKDDPTSQPGVASTKDTKQVSTEELSKQQQAKGDGKVYLYRGKGCPQCGDTGYKSRIGIFEVLAFDEKIGNLVMEHRSSETIEKMAIENGMITMIQDGFLKALRGVTTVEEVLRVIS